MCYDIQAQLESQLQRARRDGDLHAIEEIMENIVPFTDLPIHHNSGFMHPSLFIYTDEDPSFPKVSTWGLVPSDAYDKQAIWNKTLNARGETIFKLPSFRESAKRKRCLIYIDGFYEHHHHDGETFPFYICKQNKEPLALAGLWSEWVDEKNGSHWNTFAIVTTTANPLMANIHNNPKAREPRMPVILSPDDEDKWIVKFDAEQWEKGQKKALQELIKPYPKEELDYYTVNKLRGKMYKGNIEEIDEEVVYPELKDIVFST